MRSHTDANQPKLITLAVFHSFSPTIGWHCPWLELEEDFLFHSALQRPRETKAHCPLFQKVLPWLSVLVFLWVPSEIIHIITTFEIKWCNNPLYFSSFTRKNKTYIVIFFMLFCLPLCLSIL
ncbi:hypothetical protein ILYODFUR_017614 [Ilyodon furcidens]|uniref:Uncharacterized protein n=1 Tax=Ilyodon furcidens TaxID=33524 RepID=A0ABV0UIS8_9TELE